MAGGAGAGRKATDSGHVSGGLGAEADATSPIDAIAGDAAEVASGIKDAAKEQGRALLDAARGQAQSFADSRKDSAAQAIADIAASIRESGNGLADRPNVNAFVGTAADGLDQLASSLRDRSLAEIYGDVEDFARRQPMAVAAGALIGGFLLARFIKSSSEDLSEKSSAIRAEAASAARSGRPVRRSVSA